MTLQSRPSAYSPAQPPKILRWDAQAENHRSNAKWLRLFLPGIALLLCLLVVLGFEVQALQPAWPLCGIALLLTLTAYIILRGFAPDKPFLYTLLNYAYHMSMMLLCMFYAQAPGGNVLPACLWLTVVPCGLFDKPIRIRVMLAAIGSLAFLCLILLGKPETALAGLLPCTLLSMVLQIGFENARHEWSSTIQLLEQKCDIDYLTGLPNRWRLSEDFDHWAQDEAAHTGTLVGIVDVDCFKRYNDTLGHPQGDLCLSQLGECFRAFMKEYGATIYRFGGEEFLLFCRQIPAMGAEKLCRILLSRVEALRLFFPTSPTGYVTVSIGYAQADENPDLDLEALISHADGALYLAKGMEGNSCANAAEL